MRQLCLHPRENTSGTIRTIYGAVTWPVTASDQAFRLLRRRILKLGQPKSPVANEKSFEDADTGSALAIFIPKRFAPLLVDKWEMVGEGQHSLLLDHGRHPILDPFRKHDRHSRFNSIVTEGSGLGVGEPKKTQNQDNLENARIEEDY
jgi:hypothetical protein